MPLYEYKCQECGHRFEELVQVDARPGCSACGSRKLKKLVSAFAVVGGGGSGASASDGDGGFGGGSFAGGSFAGGSFAGGSFAGGGCGTCGDPRGEGACDRDD